VKTKIFRMGLALSSVAMLIEVLGAGKKWG
jgi:hypothetical protein